MAIQSDRYFMCTGCNKTTTVRGEIEPEELEPCICEKGKWELLAELGGTSSGVHIGTCSVCGGELEMVPGGVVGYRCTKCGHLQRRKSHVIGS